MAQAVIRKCGFKQLNHPPYSPDLAPSDYFLFRHLKKHMRGNHYSSDEEMIDAVESYLRDQPEDFYFEGINSLFLKWRKCIDIGGIILKNKTSFK